LFRLDAFGGGEPVAIYTHLALVPGLLLLLGATLRTVVPPILFLLLLVTPLPSCAIFLHTCISVHRIHLLQYILFARAWLLLLPSTLLPTAYTFPHFLLHLPTPLPPGPAMVAVTAVSTLLPTLVQVAGLHRFCYRISPRTFWFDTGLRSNTTLLLFGSHVLPPAFAPGLVHLHGSPRTRTDTVAHAARTLHTTFATTLRYTGLHALGSVPLHHGCLRFVLRTTRLRAPLFAARLRVSSAARVPYTRTPHITFYRCTVVR